MGARRVGLLETFVLIQRCLTAVEPTQLPHPEEAPLGAVSKDAPRRPDPACPADVYVAS
jgi:hypothetical protein